MAGTDPETGLWLDPQQLKIWKGSNDGQTWSDVVTGMKPEFEGIIRHFHTVRYDPYEDLFWIGSGDWSVECAVYTIKPNGTDFAIIAQGALRSVQDFVYVYEVWGDALRPDGWIGRQISPMMRY